MIYKVTLRETTGAKLEIIHIRADSIVEAHDRAVSYGQREWTVEVRVSAIEETDIVLVEAEQ